MTPPTRRWPPRRPRSRACCSPTTSRRCRATLGYRGPTACNAAGITYRQLDYWARTGLVEPTVRGATGSGTQRLYSFRDILMLKVVKRLLDAGISLQKIRTAVAAPARARHRRPDPRHADERRRLGLRVHQHDEVIDLLQGGQGVFGIAIGGVWREIEGTLAELPERAHRRRRRREPIAGDELAARRAARTPAEPPHRPVDGLDAHGCGRRRRCSRLVGWRALTIPHGRVSGRRTEPAGAPKGQFLPGTSQAPGPRGQATLKAPPTTGRRDRGGGAPDPTPSSRSPPCQTIPRLTELDAALPFVDRHIGLRRRRRRRRCSSALGYDSLDALMDAAVPGGDPRRRRRSTCPPPLTEDAVARELRAARRAQPPGRADDRPRLLRHDHARR